MGKSLKFKKIKFFPKIKKIYKMKNPSKTRMNAKNTNPKKTSSKHENLQENTLVTGCKKKRTTEKESIVS